MGQQFNKSGGGHHESLWRGVLWNVLVGSWWLRQCGLSGFLLARPLIRQPAQVLSAHYWSDFFLRRIRRIVPAYYVYIIAIYVLTYRSDVAIRHFLFLQGDGHLWVVPQEALFYILTPILIAANVLIFRNRTWVIIVGLTVLMVLANTMLDKNIIALYGLEHRGIRPYLGVFLAGMIASYLYYGVYEPLKESCSGKDNHSSSTDTLLMATQSLLMATHSLLMATQAF